MSEVKNSYPDLPEIAYQRTSVTMPQVIAFAKTLMDRYSNDVVRMAYAIFRNESANGLRGVNNNYAGIQADCGPWKHLPGNAIATCIKKDSGNDMRRFLCFGEDGYEISFELLCIKVQQRNMITADDYFKKWVGHPATDIAKNNFENLLRSGAKIFV